MKGLFACLTCKENVKCYTAVIILKFIYTGQSLLTKASISQGMPPNVFAAYQQAIATLALAPFAFYLERDTSTPLTLKILSKIITIAVLGLTLTYYFYFTAMKFVSATFIMAMGNTLPMVVYIMAVCLRMEKLAINRWYGRAKMIGCTICLSGAMVFSFYKGPAMYHIGKEIISTHKSSTRHDQENWVKGFFLTAGSTLTWALWIIFQGPIQKEYSPKLRLTTLQCFFSSIASSVWVFAEYRNFSVWKLSWDVNLIAVVYSGFMVCGISYWLQVWLVDKRIFRYFLVSGTHYQKLLCFQLSSLKRYFTGAVC
ncbi:hypothetical protein Leryth_026518 [Lithospermum erythrorhizon]|nr:hypothetical protein Leryth_026518 [Lithospermum erythrorhizon]